MPIAAQDETPGAYAGRAIRSEAQIDAIRRHVDELSQGAAFKGSHRSQQFLRYIVEKTLAGSVEGVKERTIGVELFQKSPTYDTVFQFRSFTGSKIPGQTIGSEPEELHNLAGDIKYAAKEELRTKLLEWNRLV